MKVIDLLNKIANGEKLPLKIKVKGYEYGQSNGQYWCDKKEMYLIDNCTSIYHLNDEVEIIEEDKKIEKLNKQIDITKFANEYKEVAQCLTNFSNKINEIIDYINKGDN